MDLKSQKTTLTWANTIKQYTHMPSAASVFSLAQIASLVKFKFLTGDDDENFSRF